MSGTEVAFEEDGVAQAGEYVLGTLEAGEARAFELAMDRDTRLRALVQAWEARLEPLTLLAPPIGPPPNLWDRIAASLARQVETRPVQPPVQPPVQQLIRPPLSRDGRQAGRTPWLWRGWALASTAIAAGLAAFLLLRPAAEPQLMTVLLTQRDQPAWVVESRGNALRLAALNPQPVATGRVLQLWALPPGATAPTSLGLIPADGRFTVAPGGITPQPGMLIEISLEPPGGSPLGNRPSGPVLFIGQLRPATGA